MKLKIDDLFLDNSFHSMNLERRLVVTIPYQYKYYILISEMNLTFKQTNPKNFCICNEKDMDLESDDVVVEKSFITEQDLMSSFQEEVSNYLENIDQKKWESFCEEKYKKNNIDFTAQKQEKEQTRNLNFNKSVQAIWKDLKSEHFILGNDQNPFEWEIFWKNLQMQKLSKKLSYKKPTYNKKRKI